MFQMRQITLQISYYSVYYGLYLLLVYFSKSLYYLEKISKIFKSFFLIVNGVEKGNRHLYRWYKKMMLGTKKNPHRWSAKMS